MEVPLARMSKRATKRRMPTMAGEFAEAELGDARRTRRLQLFAESFAESPTLSLPELSGNAAALEANYRFVENDGFGFADLMAPHYQATGERCREAASVLVLHDVTECSFPLAEHRRDGLARLSRERQGFRLQASLAIAGDGSNRPIGLLGAETWSDRMKGATEARRWCGFVDRSRGSAPAPARLVHVVDREGDAYELLSHIDDSRDGFVIRVRHRHTVETDEEGGVERIQELVARLGDVYETTVPLSKRRRKFERGKVNASRDARVARLSFAAAAVRLKERGHIRSSNSLSLNLVVVKELDAPDGEEPVEWLLATTEPIGSKQQILKVVDIYRARWLIEEFFKALKTGCAFEKRQLESMAALEKVLAISLVVAWRSLLLRHESRRDPSAPATTALTKTAIEVLRRTGKIALPPRPTTSDALRAVAALGGHIKNNGPPGWLVLSRGMERLQERVVGWCYALGLPVEL